MANDQKHIQLIMANGQSCTGCGEPALFLLEAGLQRNLTVRTNLCGHCWNQIEYDADALRDAGHAAQEKGVSSGG